MSIFQRAKAIPKEELLFSRKAFIKLMIPLIIQQVLNVTVGTVDSMMVSYAGEAAVSGVSLVNSLDTLLIIFFTALVTGGSVVITHTLGRGDAEGIKESAKQLLYIATAGATLLTVTILIFRGPLLSLLFGEVEDDVMASASIYFFFVALSFPLLAITSSVDAMLRASGNTLTSLLVSLAINIINVCGNAVLIMGFNMGAAGAAISTTFSRLVGTVILLIIAHNKKSPVHVEKLLHYKPDFKIIKKILYIGVPNGIESSMFQFGRLLTQTLISTMGTAVIAANADALTVCNFQYIIGTACSSAMVTTVGRCIGAGKEDQAKYYSRSILAFNYVMLWSIILVTMAVLSPIVSVYNLSGFSSELAKELVIYHSICAALIWPIGFMLPSSFRAAGDVRFSLVISMISMWTLRVAGAYVLALDVVSVLGLFSFPGLGMGIMGVWIAMTVDWVFRAAFFLFRYLSGGWLRANRI